MGDGPKDDKTAAGREVPSEAPGEQGSGKQEPVDGSTEVLRQLPARDPAIDATTKVLRQVPPAREEVDEDVADSPTQVVRAVPPKQAAPSANEATPAAKPSVTEAVPAAEPSVTEAASEAKQATPSAKASSGSSVDGPPTTVMRPVTGKQTNPGAGASPVDASPADVTLPPDAKPSADAKPSTDAKSPTEVTPPTEVKTAGPAKPEADVDSPTTVIGNVGPKPAEKPAEEPATKPAEQPAEEPATKPAEQPAEEPAADESASAAEASTAGEPEAQGQPPAPRVEDAPTVAVPVPGPGKSAIEMTQGPEPAQPVAAPEDKPTDVSDQAKTPPDPDSDPDSKPDTGGGTTAVVGAAATAAAMAAAVGAKSGASTDKADSSTDKPDVPGTADADGVEGAETTVDVSPSPEAATTPAPATTPASAAAPPSAPPRAAPVRIEPSKGRWPVSEPPTPRRGKRKLVLIGAVLVVLLGLGGWVLTLAHGSLKDVPEVIAPSPPKVTLAYQPGDGTAPVSPTTPVTVTATDGELREVTFTAEEGTPIKGELSPDRRTWTVSQPLAYGKTYTWAGTASDVDDKTKTVPLAGTVTTVKPKKTTRGTINIGDGRVVGIAAPVEIQFNGHVTDRAAVERALKVDTSVPTVGGWAWFQDEGGGSRIRWRPQAYWQPGTKVNVTAPMFGVDYGAGAWGAANISTSFTIGRSQITKADVNSHQLVVLRDGQQVFNFPASYGLGSDPERNTRNGIHVVSEKFTDKRMVNPKYGYDVMEKWAVRISNNGEFIHANQLTVGVQGSRNITHGCVNLSLTNAKQYYDSAMYGDPVEVTGSPIPLSAKDGDIWDWTLDWDQWTRLSALNGS